MKILLLSAYDAASHQRWREGLVNQFPQYQWTVLTLPPRHFRWRVRGNSLSWAYNQRQILEQAYDLLITTSMTDLSALRGLVPNLCTIPTIVYFHENQFAYPASQTANSHQRSLLSIQVTNLYTALCGDVLVFNSAYNRDSFGAGVDSMLQKFPDQVPAGLTQVIANKSRVLPVPLESSCFGATEASKNSNTFDIVWNHRWEYDKGPDRLLACIKALPPQLPLRFHIVGQQFRDRPEVFSEIKHCLQNKEWLGHWGFVENPLEYRVLLQSCHAVLSTSLHDFQGLAVLEAVAAGCVPIVPRRLAYPEWFDASYCYESQPEHVAGEADAAAAMVDNLVKIWSAGKVLKCPDIGELSWTYWRPRYRELIASTAS